MLPSTIAKSGASWTSSWPQLATMNPAMVKEQHHEGDYSHSPWVEVNDYPSPHTQSPAQEYGAFGYLGTSHGLPMEPTYARPLLPLYTTYQSSQPMMTTTWPSMLTSPSSQPPPVMPLMPAAPLPLAPVSSFAPVHPLPPLSNPVPQSTARRTLTDQDRQRMCQYHEDNPTVKQTEIGGEQCRRRWEAVPANWKSSDVWRREKVVQHSAETRLRAEWETDVPCSTVSKVLRQKDKYLFPDDGSRSPIKRSKGKFPDIERALSNWARNHQRQGLPLSDSIIRDKARFFATTVGSSESHLKVNSNSWLDKFKQKNHLLGAKPCKSSDANDSDSGLNADSQSGRHTPNGISPISPTGIASPSPITPNPTRDHATKIDSPDGYLDFSTYRHTHSQSATSLASYSDAAASSFSAGPQSPSSPFFSPEINYGPQSYSPSQYPRLTNMAAANTARPRSQTFPMLGIEPAFGTPPGSADGLTPIHLQQIMAAPALETPLEELTDSPLVGPSLNQHPASQAGSNVPTPNHGRSPTLMAPPPPPLTSSSSPNTSNLSSPVSPPSQDEARRALELVMSFFSSQPTGAVGAMEYNTMIKLMEKLRLQNLGGELPGGMHAVVVDDREPSRKRSIHTL